MSSTIQVHWRTASRLCLAAALLVTSGCGSADTHPDTAPVSGIVTLAGEPVAGALVTFHPTDGGVAAGATTDASGAFEVTTYFDLGKTSKPGMTPGEYIVTVSKLDKESIKTTMQPPKSLLPARYESQRSSGLTASITSEGPNELEYSLEQ